jgi:hypothetical protein
VVAATPECSVADTPLVTLDAQTSEGTVHYIERTNTCSPPPVGVHAAANVDGMRAAFAALVPEP